MELEVVRSYFKTLRLLCVEDSNVTMMIYQAVFGPLFGEVIEAKNGEEALEIVKNNHIDILLSDYDMPIMNGLDMIRVIRQKDKKIPIIFVTAIEDSDVIIEALHLNVTNFLKKPIDIDSLLDVMDRSVKIIIADQMIEKEKQEALQKQKDKDAYISYQEELAFLKELNISKNDFYHQCIGSKNESIIDFIYMPLDTLSGDSYSARAIGDNHYFFLIVDGMGKGISASYTSILMTAFINYKIDKMISSKEGFDLTYLIEESINYIQVILLEDEMLAISYIEVDFNTSNCQYALFSMPPILLQNSEGKVEKIRSNNPPLSSYGKSFNINSHDITDIIKYLFYSDGLNESELNLDDGIYSQYIENDFKKALTREDLKRSYLEKVKTQEDDITAIFIHKLELEKHILFTKEIESSIAYVEEVQEWYEAKLSEFIKNEEIVNNATVTFTEMILNAHEHGNMAIDYEKKHAMISDGSYWDYLEECESKLVHLKKIKIKVYKLVYYDNQEYIITNIEDEGDGFDTQILTRIFRNRDKFNGKGVYISHQRSDGIYYNHIGNSVTFIHKLL